jgi:hypothetical protein
MKGSHRDTEGTEGTEGTEARSTRLAALQYHRVRW